MNYPESLSICCCFGPHAGSLPANTYRNYSSVCMPIYVCPIICMLFYMGFSCFIYVILYTYIYVQIYMVIFCTHIPTYLPACLPTYLPSYLPSTYLPTDRPTDLPTYLHAHRPWYPMGSPWYPLNRSLFCIPRSSPKASELQAPPVFQRCADRESGTQGDNQGLPESWRAVSLAIWCSTEKKHR